VFLPNQAAFQPAVFFADDRIDAQYATVGSLFFITKGCQNGKLQNPLLHATPSDKIPIDVGLPLLLEKN
jgi:hypothetical protein